MKGLPQVAAFHQTQENWQNDLWAVPLHFRGISQRPKRHCHFREWALDLKEKKNKWHTCTHADTYTWHLTVVLPLSPFTNGRLRRRECAAHYGKRIGGAQRRKRVCYSPAHVMGGEKVNERHRPRTKMRGQMKFTSHFQRAREKLPKRRGVTISFSRMLLGSGHCSRLASLASPRQCKEDLYLNNGTNRRPSGPKNTSSATKKKKWHAIAICIPPSHQPSVLWKDCLWSTRHLEYTWNVCLLKHRKKEALEYCEGKKKKCTVNRHRRKKKH